MKIQKIAVAIIATLAMSAMNFTSNAAEINASFDECSGIESSQTNERNLLTDVGKVVDGGKTVINGRANNLYRVFSNQEDAIDGIKAKVPTLLALLSKEYDLPPLSDDNWKEYMGAMYMLFDSENKPSDYNESNVEFRTLRAFFDIYENAEKNEAILDYSAQLSEMRTISAVSENVEDELAFMLPYSEPFVMEHMAKNSIQNRAKTYDVDSAIEYANTYATSPNKSDYHYFTRGDCANFASQILDNSGVSQIVYDDAAKGWWHKCTTGFLGIKKHTHSESWSMADTFARYQGIVYSTTSNSSFQSNISKGSFIVADFDNDGDWDHCGFVSDKTSSDYKVAQHTSNYNAWASTDTNSWDLIGADGGKYARVRE